MTDRLRLTLYSAQQGHAAWVDAWKWAKAMLIAGHRLTLEIRKATRSLEQNSHFHAICADFERSGIAWFGKRRTAREWKVLLVSGHAIATGEQTDMVPGLEGEPVNLRESTAEMSVARKSSLIEYAIALGAHQGVRFSAPEYREAA